VSPSKPPDGDVPPTQWIDLQAGRDAVTLPPPAFEADTSSFLRGGHPATRVARRGYEPLVAGALAGLALVAVAALGAGFVLSQRKVDARGPVFTTVERYASVGVDEPVDPALREAVALGFSALVMAPNATAANWPELAEDRAAWDPVLLDRVARAAAAHARQWPFWGRLEATRADYAATVLALRAAGLPDVLAALPFAATGYRADATGPACERGPWLLTPESALRGGLAVRDCTLRGVSVLWSPDSFLPGARPPYIESGTCRLDTCVIDQRPEVTPAATAAARLLSEAWRDPQVAASGAAVQLTLAAYDAGFDDARFDDTPHPTNVLPALRAALPATGVSRAPTFLGDTLRCEKPGPDTCGGVLPGTAQHRVYTVIADHLLAVCYYGRHHSGTEAAFTEWASYADGYCTGIAVPEIPT
jgi:hypothetical protein